ncbi:tyrosine-type recombinase/integrase [Paenibacillus sp. GXUN7292]|uniref:tyrosine-type recombinase/integrase n=1 Tax=Paenibacillus sp. GXUN7292 TaxID=3422499 RepID=UPI003D7C98E0
MANIQKRGENSWFFTVNAGRGPDGKYIRRTKTLKVEDQVLLKTKKRLQDYLDAEYVKFKAEVEAGEYIAPQKMTFAAFVEEWEQKYAVKHLQPTTLEIYMIYLNNRVIPAIGHMRIEDITTYKMINFVGELQNSEKADGTGKIAAGTVQYILRALRNVFNRAVEWKLIKENPLNGVKKPKGEKTKVNVYTAEEAQELLAALKGEFPYWRVLITLALTTGLRRGELLGLEWKHIDLEAGTLRVEQALSTTKQNRFLISEPKTENSIRTVSLPASVIKELKEYKTHCNKERLKLGDLWKGGDRNFVFTVLDGKPMSPYSVNGFWTSFTKKHNLRYIRFHDLRHTSATLLLNSGVHAKVISDRLGHADITTTLNIYAHTLKTADEAAANKFDDLLSIKTK